MPIRTGLILSVVILLNACSNTPTKQQPVANVTSTPSGAVVYANGLNIGSTPLKRNLYKDFPAAWKNLVYQAAGVLMIKKDGCKDYVLNVNDYVLSQPVHADLDCVDSALNHDKKKESGHAVTPTTLKAPNLTESKGSVEKRLEKAKVLHQKGLINDQEYQQIKARILDEL